MIESLFWVVLGGGISYAMFGMGRKWERSHHTVNKILQEEVDGWTVWDESHRFSPTVFEFSGKFDPQPPPTVYHEFDGVDRYVYHSPPTFDHHSGWVGDQYGNKVALPPNMSVQEAVRKLARLTAETEAGLRMARGIFPPGYDNHIN